MPLKLIVFDLDGTLVDSKFDITNAINYAIRPMGLPELTPEDAIRFVGEGITRLIEKILGNDHAEKKPYVMEKFLRYYSEHLIDNTMPYKGVMKTLQSMNAYKKAVISNKREDLSRRLLEGLGLAAYFDLILGADSVAERKPSPVPVLKAMEILHATPRETIMVGDSNIDIEAGKKAGVKTIAVAYGYKPIEYLKGADYIIRDSLNEIVSILEEMNLSMTS